MLSGTINLCWDRTICTRSPLNLSYSLYNELQDLISENQYRIYTDSLQERILRPGIGS